MLAPRVTLVLVLAPFVLALVVVLCVAISTAVPMTAAVGMP